MRIGITGASGMIGQGVSALALSAGHEIIGYSRRPPAPGMRQTRAMVSTATQALPETPLDVLVHLAGESLLGLWTQAKRERMWQSRVDYTQRLVRELKTWQPEHRPKVLLSASGIGYYGDRGEAMLEESSGCGRGFLAELCQAWEAAAQEAVNLGIRVVHLRTSMVLGRRGGALPLMRRAFSVGLGGRLGSGNQWMSWIHEQDQAAMILWAAETDTVSGALNLCSPNPVTNATFTRLLAAELKRPAFMHVPAFALRRMLPGMAEEMLLGSQRALPRVATTQGYPFAHPQLAEALNDLL